MNMNSHPFRYKHNRLQQLRGFCAVVESNSVSRAAARLNLTQPTVSLQVQALERELRATLFERRGPKLELTPEGEVLFELGRLLRDYPDWTATSKRAVITSNVDTFRSPRRIYYSICSAFYGSEVRWQASWNFTGVEQRSKCQLK